MDLFWEMRHDITAKYEYESNVQFSTYGCVLKSRAASLCIMEYETKSKKRSVRIYKCSFRCFFGFGFCTHALRCRKSFVFVHALEAHAVNTHRMI